jgi:hypothetical protein
MKTTQHHLNPNPRDEEIPDTRRTGVCSLWWWMKDWNIVHAVVPSLFLSRNHRLLQLFASTFPGGWFWGGRCWGGGGGDFIKLTAASVLLRRAENSQNIVSGSSHNRGSLSPTPSAAYSFAARLMRWGSDELWILRSSDISLIGGTSLHFPISNEFIY